MNFLPRLAKRAGRLAKGRAGEGVGPLSLMHLGFTFAASVLFYTFVGLWLDKKLELLPLFTILGMLIGATGGFIWIYREVLRAEKRARDMRAEADEDAAGEDSVEP